MTSSMRLSRPVSDCTYSLISSAAHALTLETNNIVRWPAVTQSLKGLVSAGPLKSARYSAAKVGKWWASSK
jgi:hypothetical protein